MKKGFTLIELLVVVLIIGILAAVALPQYEKAVEKSRATEAIINMQTIVNNVEMVILSTGGTEDKEIYANPENWDVQISGGTWKTGGCCGPELATKDFLYLSGDDATGVTVLRCKGTCEVEGSSEYYLFQTYPSIDGENVKICEGHTPLGKNVCKSLVSQGFQDRS